MRRRWLSGVAACIILYLCVGISPIAHTLPGPPEANADELNKIRAAFARAGQYPADATDGQHQFGNISIVNNSGACDQAESWIRQVNRDNAPGTFLGAVSAQKSAIEVEQIRFSFDPTDPTREREGPSVYMVLRGSGEATVFIFERNESVVTGVYKGTLARKVKARLTARIQGAIKEAAGAPADPHTIRESDLFSMSVKYKSGAAAGIGGKVEDMPPATRALVDDLRTLWKRFGKLPPAAAYVRSEAIGKERLALLLKEGRLRFARVEDFGPELQSLLRDVTRGPADFHPVSRPQLEQLRSRASFGELFLTDGEAGYKISFFLPKQGRPDAEKRHADEQSNPYEKRGSPRRPRRARNLRLGLPG